jgi:membrane protein DedA with SNARE-associated domain
MSDTLFWGVILLMYLAMGFGIFAGYLIGRARWRGKAPKGDKP